MYLYDAEGKSYLDFGSGIAVNALGYGDPGLKAALHAASDGLIHTSNLYRTAPGEQLAATLVARSFASKAFFCNSGAEANEGAFKFARRWARTIGEAKHEIIALRGAFHGRLFGSLAATDRPSYRRRSVRSPRGSRSSSGTSRSSDAALNAETVAALIVEPIQGEGGVRVLDHGFLRELRAVTKARSIALIFDEIQCGLGRTGTLFAYEQVGVEPDMLTLAKPLAGGLPMGAVLMTEPIAAAMQVRRSRDDIRRRSVRGVGRAARSRPPLRSGAPHARARDRRVVRPGAERDRASHQPHPAGARGRVHVGHRRDGHGGARRERSDGPRTARCSRRASTPFASFHRSWPRRRSSRAGCTSSKRSSDGS